MAVPTLKIDIEADDTLRALRRIAGDQFPFALARGLTQLAKMGQESGQARTRRAFDLHGEFIPRGIGIVPARKADVKLKARADAAVVTKERISAFMPAHELGATKTPTATGGRDRGRFLAIPGAALRKKQYQTRTGRVRKQYKPAKLLERYSQLSPRDAARVRGSRERFGPRTPFIVRGAGGGRLLIVRRASPQTSRPLEVLYVLVPKARIRESWRLHDAVREVVIENYREVLARSIEHAVATAR